MRSSADYQNPHTAPSSLCRRDILGLLLVKELVLVNPLDHLPVGALRLRELPRLEGETPMYDLLRLFETGKSHMVLLTAVPEPVGSRAAHVGRRTGEAPPR